MYCERQRGLALAAGLCILTSAVHAGPPLITEDPDTPGRDQWEINLSYELEVIPERVIVDPGRGRTFVADVLKGVFAGAGLDRLFGEIEAPSRSRRRRSLEHAVPLLDINYGFTERDQLKLEVPALIQDPADGSTEGGFGPIQVGYKYRFLEDPDFPVSVSVYPQMDIPTAADRLDVNNKPAYLIPVQFGRHLMEDRLFLYGEVGFVAAPGSETDDEWFYGVAAEWEIIEAFELLGEVHGIVPTHGTGSRDVIFNLGFKWQIHDHIAVLSSMGRSFRSARDGRPELIGFWGIQWTF